jgi:hypothetical protein
MIIFGASAGSICQLRLMQSMAGCAELLWTLLLACGTALAYVSTIKDYQTAVVVNLHHRSAFDMAFYLRAQLWGRVEPDCRVIPGYGFTGKQY